MLGGHRARFTLLRHADVVRSFTRDEELIRIGRLEGSRSP